MDAGRLIRIAGKVAAARLAGRRSPIAVGWALTDRCDSACAYCGLPKRARPELSTQTVLDLVDELAAAGVELVSFTGGEPLLRDDLEPILARARKAGLVVKLNTNGRLVPRRIEALRSCHTVQISLDGDARVHDAVRGKGGFAAAQSAAKALAGAAIPFGFLCTISSANVDGAEAALDVAREWGVGVAFQPALRNSLGDESANPVAPDPAAYRALIDRLLRRRLAGDRSIRNSPRALRHLRRWPDPASIPCAAGRIACRIETDGELVLCGREPAGSRSTRVQDGFRRAFEGLAPTGCRQCWCASVVDLNYLFGLRPDVGWHLNRRGGY